MSSIYAAMKHSKEGTADMHKRNSDKDCALFVLLSCEKIYIVRGLRAVNSQYL